MKRLIQFAGLSLLAFSLAACSQVEQKKATQESKVEQSEKITVTDNQNHTVTIPKDPKKVIAFDNGALDTIDALGKGKQVIAAATENIPEYLKQYKNVTSAGGIKEPDLEKIHALKPDLILISGRQEDFYDQLQAIAPTLFVGVESDRFFDSFSENTRLLGKIFNQEKVANEKIKEAKQKAQKVNKKATATKENALIVLTSEGQLSAYGKNSRFGIIHDIFGFLPVDDTIQVSTHGQSISYEYILEKDPDFIFVIDRTKAIGGKKEETPFEKNPIIQKTKAGKNKQVIFLNPELWYLSGGGIESFSLMTKEVNEVFQEKE